MAEATRVDSFSSDASSSSSTTTTMSPLSLNIDELGTILGGKGRALAAWDCIKIGIDPLLYYGGGGRRSFDPVGDDLDANVGVDMDVDVDEGASDLDKSVSDCMRNLIPPTTREDIETHLPVRRRTEGLGKEALKLLSDLMQRATSYSSSSSSSSKPPPPPHPPHSPIGIEGGIATLSHISTSKDGTTKLLITLAKDGLQVETVIIPWDDRGRSTLCISSQVGCRQGCTFCATGRMGKLRSLTPDEILVQVYFSSKVCRVLNILPVDGIVFMGMGEPADNTDAVIHAASILTNRNLFALSSTRVTISTVAPTPDSFRTLARANVALAWSVHSTKDHVRAKLVPTTRYTMEELKRGYVDAMLERTNKKLRTSMLEVVLIDNINDGIDDADHLANFALSIVENVPDMKLMVNLIPFNDIGHKTYRKPDMKTVWSFQDRLTSRGVFCFVRTTRGDDESAACGQLVTTRGRKMKAVADSSGVGK